MAHGESRRFTLLDTMVLVVAIAAGLTITRSFHDFENVFRHVNVTLRAGGGHLRGIEAGSFDYLDRGTAAYYQPPVKGQIIFWARQLSFWPGPCLAALSLVTLVLGFRHAHQAPDRLAKGPGTAACIAVLLAMATAAVRLPQLLLATSMPGQALHPRWAEWWLEFWFTVPELAGFAVMVYWATLALSGNWRAGEGWPNRLGLALGIGWVGMAAMDLAATWYHALPF